MLEELIRIRWGIFSVKTRFLRELLHLLLAGFCFDKIQDFMNNLLSQNQTFVVVGDRNGKMGATRRTRNLGSSLF